VTLLLAKPVLVAQQESRSVHLERAGALGKGSMTLLSEQFPVFLNICSPLGLHHSASSAAVNPSTPASPMCPDPAPDPHPACPTPHCVPAPTLPPTPEINSGESDYPESPLL